MTEQEWLECTDPTPMLGFVGGKASDRKLRLFACECSHRIWHLLNEENRNAVSLVEDYCEGSTDTATALTDRGGYGMLTFFGRWSTYADSVVFGITALQFNHKVAQAVSYAAAKCLAKSQGELEVERFRCPPRDNERMYQTHLIRCIFGLLHFRPVSIDPVWLTWNDCTVRRIVQSIYEERAFDRMPVLGDALEDAGCDNADILNHCSQPGTHVKGCWVVDAVLGKE